MSSGAKQLVHTASPVATTHAETHASRDAAYTTPALDTTGLAKKLRVVSAAHLTNGDSEGPTYGDVAVCVAERPHWLHGCSPAATQTDAATETRTRNILQITFRLAFAIVFVALPHASSLYR